MGNRLRDAIAAGAIVLLVASAAAWSPIRTLEGWSIDILFWLRDRAFGPMHQPDDSPAVVLAVDEETYRRPPFSDTPQAMWTPELGRVLDALLAAGAKVIGFDIVYPTSVEPFLRGFEREFLLALRRGARDGRIVLGRVQHQEKPIAPFAGYAIAVGRGDNIRALNVFEDDDGVIRRLPLIFRVGTDAAEARDENALAVEIATRAQGQPPGTLPERGADGRFTIAGYRLPREQSDNLMINFDGGAGDIPSYSLADIHACVAAGKSDYLERHFRGRTVFVGVTLDVEDRKLTSKRLITRPEGLNLPERCIHPVMSDLYKASLRRDSIPGVYIHATAFNNLVRGDALAPLAAGTSFSLILGMTALIGFAVMTLSPLAAGFAVALSALAWTAFATVAFRFGVVLPFLQALGAGVAAFPALIAYRFLVTDRDRRELSRAFGLYLPRAEIDRMLSSGKPPALGGEARAISILFSDIAGFTAISEKRDPKRLVEDLNQYFSAMTEIVEAHGGFVDKFIGDAVVAVFGAPLDDPRHAERAVAAALDMRRVLNESGERFTLGDGVQLRARIGVNTGTALVGNIGSPRRFNYTVMGDAVNLASRLEGANKNYGTQIIVSEETAAACGSVFVFRELDTVRVVGRAAPVSLFEPIGARGEISKPQTAIIERFVAALVPWRRGDFVAAEAAFRSVEPDDPVARRFAERAAKYAAAPPSGWDGVVNLSEK